MRKRKIVLNPVKKREKWKTSEGIPFFFSKNFQWQGPSRLIFHRNTGVSEKMECAQGQSRGKNC